jgi:hypothetical protein
MGLLPQKAGLRDLKPSRFEGKPAGFEGKPAGFEGKPTGFEGKPGRFEGKPGRFLAVARPREAFRLLCENGPPKAAPKIRSRAIIWIAGRSKRTA